MLPIELPHMVVVIAAIVVVLLCLKITKKAIGAVVLVGIVACILKYFGVL